MGLVSKFKDYQDTRLKKRIEKAAKLIKNPKAIKDDRWAALTFLAKEAKGEPDEIIRKILPRFDFSLEHGINDSREKELALEGVIRQGSGASGVLKNWILTSSRIAWPIKALKELASESELVEALKEALDFSDVRFDQAAVDKNFDVLCYLRDFQMPDFFEKLAFFLDDPDERVRFAACEALIEQESDEVKNYLEKFLPDMSVDNRRVKQAIVAAFVQRQWPLNDPSLLEGLDLEGASLTDDGKLKS